MAEDLARTAGGDQDRPRRRVRSSFRSPLRLSRTTVSRASAIPASRSGAWRTAARKRWRQRGVVRGAIPQRSAASRIVSPAPGEAPKASQRSSWCKPDSAVPVSTPNVFPQALHRKRRRPRAVPRDTATRHPRPARSPPARPRPPAGPTAPPPLPCAAPSQLIDTREPIPKPLSSICLTAKAKRPGFYHDADDLRIKPNFILETYGWRYHISIQGLLWDPVNGPSAFEDRIRCPTGMEILAWTGLSHASKRPDCLPTSSSTKAPPDVER